MVIGRDKNVQNDFSAEIRTLCELHKVRFDFREDATSVTSPRTLAISWRWLVDLPNGRLIVLHDSLLPKYRGFAPLISQLVNGDGEIGVTAITAAEEFDQGEIISQRSRKIKYPTKIRDAIETVSHLYGDIVCELLEQINTGETLISTPQDEAAATYSLWRDEQDYLISWNDSAARIRRFVDAVGYPFQGASTYLNGKNPDS